MLELARLGGDKWLDLKGPGGSGRQVVTLEWTRLGERSGSRGHDR